MKYQWPAGYLFEADVSSPSLYFAFRPIWRVECLHTHRIREIGESEAIAIEIVFGAFWREDCFPLYPYALDKAIRAKWSRDIAFGITVFV